jgi:hypothetical protein
MSSSLGSFILGLAGEDDQSSSDGINEFIVAPIFDDEPEALYENRDIENHPEHLQTYTNTLYENLHDNEEILYETHGEAL